MPKRLVEHLKRLIQARQQLGEQIKESEASLKRLDAEIEALQDRLKQDGIEHETNGAVNLSN